MILISPSEPIELRQALGAVNNVLCEGLGADIIASTPKGLLGVQRKETPSDFLASLEDGRLCRELPLLVNGVDLPILLLEGRFSFDADNHLRIGSRPTRYTRQGISNLIRSISYCSGLSIEYSTSLTDTPSVVKELIDFLGREHKSLLKRPNLQGLWGKPTANEAMGYFYQGVPGIGVVLSQSLMKVFPAPADLINASLEDLKALPQIGKQRAERLHLFLHKGVLK